MKKYLKIKIILIIFVSFVATRLIVSEVFLASTPRINPLFIVKIKNLPSDIGSIPSKVSTFASLLFSGQSSSQNSLDGLAQVTPPAGVQFVPVARAEKVRIADDPKTGNRYMELESGAKVIIEETIINGKKYKIITPVKE